MNIVEKSQQPRFAIENKIAVPADVYAWKASSADRPKAAEVQKRNREEFLRLLPLGVAALGYERDAFGNGAFLLGRWDEDWSYAETFANPSSYWDRDWPRETP
jgi:hypothetical protein